MDIFLAVNKLNYKNNKIIFVIGLLLLMGLAIAGSRFSLFYYNPDSAQSNLGQLKTDVDMLFTHNKNDVTFQAFSHFSDFDKQLRANRPILAYVPHWYLQQYGEELGLSPLLHSVRDDKTTYNKLLITNISSSKKAGGLKDASMAMTTLGPESRSILNKVLFTEHNVNADTLSIVEVPKDTDAVFAVALGQVDSALVSEASLRRLEKRNPRLTAAVKIVAETKPLALPILCYFDGTLDDAALAELRKQFLNSTPFKSKSIFSIFNIDTWRAQL